MKEIEKKRIERINELKLIIMPMCKIHTSQYIVFLFNNSIFSFISIISNLSNT